MQKFAYIAEPEPLNPVVLLLFSNPYTDLKLLNTFNFTRSLQLPSLRISIT